MTLMHRFIETTEVEMGALKTLWKAINYFLQGISRETNFVQPQ